MERMPTLLLLGCLLGPTIAYAQSESEPKSEEIPCTRLAPDDLVSLDLKDVSLADLTRVISCWTGRRFLLPGDPVGRITLLITEPVTVAQAFKAYLQALDSNGLTAVKRGRFLRIVKKSHARSTSPIAGRGPMVTEFWKVRHMPTEDARDLVRLFASDGADVTSYAPQRTLIVTELTANIPRVKSVLAEFDRPGAAQRVFVRPARTDARALVEVVAKVQKALGPGAGRVGVVADERTNQLIVVGDRGGYTRMDRLIRRLDRPGRGDRRFHFVRLKHADAKELGDLLQRLQSSPPRARSRSRRRARRSKGHR